MKQWAACLQSSRESENRMENAPAIQFKFAQGKVQIYVDNVLRLETDWPGPPETSETNPLLKRWATNLTEDSDESSEGIGGTAGLVGEGFAQGPDNVWRRSQGKR